MIQLSAIEKALTDGNTAKAEQLFHQFIVEQSAKIYEQQENSTLHQFVINQLAKEIREFRQDRQEILGPGMDKMTEHLDRLDAILDKVEKDREGTTE